MVGPGSISLLIALYQDYNEITDQVIACLAMAAVALVIFLVMRSAHYLSRILGASGIVAISRIIGFIVIAIGIQYISSSIVNILQTIDFQ